MLVQLLAFAFVYVYRIVHKKPWAINHWVKKCHHMPGSNFARCWLIGRPLKVTVRPMPRDLRPVCLSVTLVYCGQTIGWIKLPLGTEVGLAPGDIVSDPAPPTRRGTAFPPHSADVCCGQTATHLSNCWALVFKMSFSAGDFLIKSLLEISLHVKCIKYLRTQVRFCF